MTNPTPSDSAQLPPLLDDLAKWEAQVRRYDVQGACNPLANTLQQARDALRAQAASVEPVGWKLVPIKCTSAMKDVGIAYEYATVSDGRLLAQSMWNELLAASPTPAHIPADVETSIPASKVIEAIEAWKVARMRIPYLADRVNKATREAMTLSHVPLFQLLDIAQQAKRADAHPPQAPQAVGEWTDEQCLQFMCMALRHVEYKRGTKGPTCDDIRLGVHHALVTKGQQS